MSREIKFRAWVNSMYAMIYDGDMFSNGKDYKRIYPCKVTNHGILYTITHDPLNEV